MQQHNLQHICAEYWVTGKQDNIYSDQHHDVNIWVNLIGYDLTFKDGLAWTELLCK